MSEAVGTLGTTLTRGAQHIAQVQDISGPDLSTDTDEITNHDSPDGVEEFIPTIKRTGEITFPLVFLPRDPTHDDDTGLLAAWADRSLDAYVLTYPDGSDVVVLGLRHRVQQQRTGGRSPLGGRDAAALGRSRLRRGGLVMGAKVQGAAAPRGRRLGPRPAGPHIGRAGRGPRVGLPPAGPLAHRAPSAMPSRRRCSRPGARAARSTCATCAPSSWPRRCARPTTAACSPTPRSRRWARRTRPRSSGCSGWPSACRGLAEDEVEELTRELGEDPSVGSGSD